MKTRKQKLAPEMLKVALAVAKAGAMVVYGS